MELEARGPQALENNEEPDNVEEVANERRKSRGATERPRVVTVALTLNLNLNLESFKISRGRCRTSTEPKFRVQVKLNAACRADSAPGRHRHGLG